MWRKEFDLVRRENFSDAQLVQNHSLLNPGLQFGDFSLSIQNLIGIDLRLAHHILQIKAFDHQIIAPFQGIP